MEHFSIILNRKNGLAFCFNARFIRKPVPTFRNSLTHSFQRSFCPKIGAHFSELACLISIWAGGHTRKANPDHLDFVLRACRTLDSSPQRPVILKGVILDTLKAERARTNIGPQALLSSERSEMAKEVNADLIYRRLSGYTKTAQKDRIDYVLGLYAALPHYRKPSGRSTHALPPDSVKLTRAAIAALKHHQKRTGLSAAAFLKQAVDAPEGLTSADIVSWVRVPYRKTISQDMGKPGR